MNNICPKCGEKLRPLYMKQTCPKCGTNLLYYKMDERLAEDARNAQQEVDALWNFARKIDKAHVIEKYCAKKNKPLPWNKEEEA